jgi:thioredoxin:protein disulfide reductase
MIDPVALSIDAIGRGDAGRLPLVALAGAVTSLGPCVAPRYVAVAALLGERRRAFTIAAFIAGMVTAYTVLGFGAGLLADIAGHASALYIALAVALAAGGIITLCRGSACDHSHDTIGNGGEPHRLSGVFCLGAASALVVSPCCTPILAAVAGMSVDANPATRAELLAAFALGHAAPLFAAGTLGTLCVRMLRAWNASPAPAVVSGALMIALAAYYGLLV